MDKNKSFSITRYAFQSFKHYGGKSIILMIALAVTLVLALLNILTSLQSSLSNQAINIGGDAHFKYDNVTPEQIELLKKQSQIEWTSETSVVPNLQANKILSAGQEQIEEANSIELVYIENLKQMDGFRITDGETPQKENEVAIPPILAEYLGIEATVGAEFEVNLISFTFNENGQTTVETPAKFTVSGIIQKNRHFEMGIELGNRYVMFVSKEFVLANLKFKNTGDTEPTDTLNEHEQFGKIDVFVKLKKGYEARKIAYEIAEIIGVEEDNIQFNNNYLFASLNDNSDRIMFYVIIIFFAIVGAIIIYNAFNIVIAKRTRHFGLLTLIGASKKQIRKCVYIEAILNTAVALPIGLLLGTFLSWLIMPVVRASYDRTGAVFSISAWSYLLTILITVLMVFAGAVIPARGGGKITPVEAAKFAPNSPKGNKKSNKFKIIKNLTLPSLARANLFRKKGGASGTITSLSIVGVLFIFLSFVLFSVYFSLGNLASQGMASDIQVGRGQRVKEGGMTYISYNGNFDILPENIIEQIKNLDGVKKSHVVYFKNYQIPTNDENANGLMESGLILGVDDEIMFEYLKQAEAHEGSKDDLTSFENPNNVLVLQSRTEYSQYDIFTPGQNVTLDIYPDYMKASDNNPMGQISLKASAIADSGNVTPYVNVYSLPSLIMPLSSFKANNFDLDCYSIHLDIDYSKYDSIIENLDRISESAGNMHYESFMERKKQYETQMMSILALVFAGLGIVFAVSVLNLISTTFIGIEQRKKELGILSALGLGREELKKMLKWEGIWVSLFSSIISIAGGFGLGCLFYVWVENMFGKDGNYIELYFPIIPIVIFCLIYIFVPYIISSIAIRRLLKNTMVELIGQEI